MASINYPYDALVVEFPHGDLVELLVNLRARDVTFVIHELSSYSKTLTFNINTSDIVSFGHSLGGAFASEALLHDNWIRGGINFD